ncbi:MAG: hypothetical protein QXK12_01390 [Candidatus Nezhaarchaeales archaeon]
MKRSAMLIMATVTLLATLLVYSTFIVRADEIIPKPSNIAKRLPNATKTIIVRPPVITPKPSNISEKGRVVVPPWAGFGLIQLTASGTAIKLGGAGEVEASVDATITYMGFAKGVRHVTLEYASVNIDESNYIFESGRAYLSKRGLLLTATERLTPAEGKRASLQKLIVMSTFKVEKWPPSEVESKIPVKCSGILITMEPGKRIEVWKLKLEGTLTLTHEELEIEWPILPPIVHPIE